ncbi:2-phosphosulfolactate phosphatase [Planctomicrobium piriforme]|uniref:Probable 2-phosphosulfolactate phosphatase n=1 Tax=Planctomicrobium piriforme TaxID=1576369 RepID=A0A1I3NGE0_9PLAN|nr:2-phosphosulfolactate phosphatase [Planctomicrobium piriforme]SFJ08361.1 2-phosphosulfolactate phosphatase [Planctomicrobium piriforme]
MPVLFAHLLPTLLEDADLSNSTCVVIDILRASTTMVHALGNGARAVIPCLNVDDAHAAADKFPASARLLGGERHGQLIPGFDLDNSPLHYGPEVVSGKTVIFTTTNGTKALWSCRTAAEVIVGAFVNRKAVCQALKRSGRDVHLICAGTDGQLTAEDILFAGSIVQLLVDQPGSNWIAGSVQTRMAGDYFAARGADPAVFRKTFFDSLGAQNLLELGMEADIERCMQPDLFDCVPHWNASTGELTIR